MKATIKMAIIRNELLEEDTKDVVFEANDRTYIGALFFEKEDIEEIVEVLEEKTVDAPVLEIMLTAYDMMKRHDRIAADDNTLKTMIHWQFMNGFSDDALPNTRSYMYENDTDLLRHLEV